MNGFFLFPAETMKIRLIANKVQDGWFSFCVVCFAVLWMELPQVRVWFLVARGSQHLQIPNVHMRCFLPLLVFQAQSPSNMPR